MITSPSLRRGLPRRRLGAAVLAASALAAAATAGPAAAQAAGPALPGPPPGMGLDLPAPPGGARGGAPAETPMTIDPAVAGPGLPTGSASLDRRTRRVSVVVSCQADGRIALKVPVVARATLASASYACRQGSARASLRLAARPARRIAKRRTAVAVVALRERGIAVTLSARLGTGAAKTQPPGGYWSDGILQCTTEGQPRGYLIAPNWTASPSTAVSARAWIAWYQARSGWHWVGTRGAGSSSWLTWTATPKGVAEWLQPTGVDGAYALTPWSVGPLTVPLGSGISVVGVVETVYWWSGRPTWVWHYVRSSVDGTSTSEEPCGY